MGKFGGGHPPPFSTTARWRRHHGDNSGGSPMAVRVAPEPAVPGIDLQKAVDRLRLQPGGLAHPLGGAPGRRAEQNVDILGGQDTQDRVDDRRLADARPAGDDRDLRGERRAYRIGLAGRQGEPGLALHPGQGLARVDVGPWEIAGGNVENAPGDRAFGPVQAARNMQGISPTVSATTVPSDSSRSSAARISSPGTSRSFAASGPSSSSGRPQ